MNKVALHLIKSILLGAKGLSSGKAILLFELHIMTTSTTKADNITITKLWKSWDFLHLWKQEIWDLDNKKVMNNIYSVKSVT